MTTSSSDTSTSPNSVSESSSTSPEESPKPSTPSNVQPRQKRNGRVVGALRRKYNLTLAGPTSFDDTQQAASSVLALSTRTANLGPSSVGGRLVSFELAGALSHHLISVAVGEMTSPDSPPVNDFGRILNDFRRMSLRPQQEPDPGHEIVRASLMALGARRTTHSAITGLAPTSSNTASHFPDYDLGRRREESCMKLAQRAIDLVEESKLLTDSSARALEIGSLVRAMVWAVSPYHPFGATLGECVVKQHRLRHGRKTVPRTNLTDSVVVYDINMSALLKKQPMITDEELPLFGFTQEAVFDALTTLSVESETPPLLSPAFASLARTICVMMLRECLKIKLGPLQTPASICPTFIHIYSHLEVLERAVVRQAPAVQTVPTTAMLSHAFTLPMVVESNLAKQCFRHIGPHVGKGDPLPDGMLRATKHRYLGWLKRVAKVLDGFPTDAQGRHVRALAYATLDIYPSWMQLAIETANMNEIQGSAATGIEFGKEDVMILYRGVKLSSTVFARSKLREEMFSRLLSEEKWCPKRVMWEGETKGAHGQNWGKEGRAEEMVQVVLSEMGGR
ncbi:hypothetical protein T439DRAFT_359364 [Meredithblackwellia eburnea MCA 4105]